MTEAVVAMDARGRIRAVNAEAERLYGVASREVLGRDISSVIEQLGLDGSALPLSAPANLGSSGAWRGRVIHRPRMGALAGRELLVDLSLIPLRDGEPRGERLLALSRLVASDASDRDEASFGLRLDESARHERRLASTLRTLQELTLLGASTDDIRQLARETIEAVVGVTEASGGGYALVDPIADRVDPVIWVGRPSSRWDTFSETTMAPDDWPPLAQLRAEETVWLAHSDEGGDAGAAQAVLPLRVGGRLSGLVHLEWYREPDWDLFDTHVLEPIARTCSISLANFRLRAEIVRRAASQRALARRLDTLDELTRIGEQATSFDELAHQTASLVREALDAAAVLYLLVEPGRQFRTQAVAGDAGHLERWLGSIPAKQAPGGAYLLAGGGSTMGDFVAGRADRRALKLAGSAGFGSFASIPIRAGQELAGALLCLFEPPVAGLPLDEGALDSVSRIGGIALANFRLRERLGSSEKRYRTVFEESPDALLVSAPDGTILDVNEAALSLYRTTRADMLGRLFEEFNCAEDRELARRSEVISSEGRGSFRDRGRRPDGSEFEVEIEVRVVELDGQGRFVQLIRDLSDQARLQRELLQAQKMEALGQLVAGVAHEINNPLAAIIGFSQLQHTDSRLPEDMRHDAGLLVQEAERTRRIVQGLLDFARARPPERTPTSIAALVRSVLELQSYALTTNRVKVEVRIPAGLPQVDVDRAQLQQVLLNLTINAVQAMRAHKRRSPPRLWVTASLARPRTSAASRSTRKGEAVPRVRISIRDNGPGVPEAARARLFDPFFTTKQPGEGTGLGLSVSFGIIAAHDGHLWYEPGPGGVGSCFTFEIPVTARTLEASPLEPPALPEPSTRTPERPAHVPRVLALDDEPAIVVLLRRILAHSGMECVPCRDGAEALEAIRAGEFDVMLVDHRMAGMSGTDFYQAAVDVRPELASRAVFMSGDVLNPDLRGFATARGIRLLAKPFDNAAVIRVVREVLAGATVSPA